MKSLGDDTKNTFYYNFDYINLQTNAVFEAVTQFGSGACAQRACHGLDLFYEFLSPAFINSLDADTIAMGKDVIQPLFEDFARGKFKKLKKTWPQYTNKNKKNKNRENFLRFLGPNNLVKESTFTSASREGANSVSEQNGLCDFWDTQGYLYGSARATTARDDDEGFMELYKSNINGLDKIIKNNDKHLDNYVEIAIGLLAIFGILMVAIGAYKCFINNGKGKYGGYKYSPATEKDPLLATIQTKY